MTVGRTKLQHHVLIAYNVDNFVIGLDVIGKFAFVLDIKNRIVKFGNEEVIFRSSLEEPQPSNCC